MIEIIKYNKKRIIITLAVILTVVLIIGGVLFFTHKSVNRVLKSNEFELVSTVDKGYEFGGIVSEFKVDNYLSKDGKYRCSITYIDDKNKMEERYNQTLDYRKKIRLFKDEVKKDNYKYIVYAIEDSTDVGIILNYGNMEILLLGPEDKNKKVLEEIIKILEEENNK